MRRLFVAEAAQAFGGVFDDRTETLGAFRYGGAFGSALACGYAVVRWIAIMIVVAFFSATIAQAQTADEARPAAPAAAQPWTRWEPLPDMPDPLGVAGPLTGVHRDQLIVAGGANFPLPVWGSTKQWHDAIYSLDLRSSTAKWTEAGRLPQLRAYAACVSTSFGVLAIGGSDSEGPTAECWLLTCAADGTVAVRPAPSLPTPLTNAAATLIHGGICVAGGQTGDALVTATDQVLWLDLRELDPAAIPGKTKPAVPRWRQWPAIPGGARSLALATAQYDGYETRLYVASGRREMAGDVRFLRDVWSLGPGETQWRRQKDAPECLMAGAAAPVGQSHILTIGGDNGRLFKQTDQLRDNHPGFVKRSYAYHTITDTWIDAGETPVGPVTTQAVPYRGGLLVPSGEIRPRVRTPNVWRVELKNDQRSFGWVNSAVLVVYLVATLGVGLLYAGRNRDSDDFFRGGQGIPWWAVGCSIFATLLSSLTYLGLPAKAFAQDWVYAVGNFLIPLVAVTAVYAAMPIYRSLNVTSIYEYLERRFNRPVRWFGSLSFATFHLFRMAVVMSLTALALAIATPLTPTQSVLLMGLLSVVYCAAGGIGAVIWTDTVQTVVLLGGAIAALAVMLLRIEGGLSAAGEVAMRDDKLRLVNWHWDVASAQLALWVVILGAIGQNVATYTADQAIAQRYVSTADNRQSARSIWIGVWMVIPATVLFFSLGTALYAFYEQHPEKLRADVAIDQIFPLFIVRELPIGLAGLVVAGVFAAAQSTVSTSMHSTATAIAIDFFGSERHAKRRLTLARTLTVAFGVGGTLLALLFIDPSVLSLFDAFIAVIGMFMGVLGGVFALGMLTRRVGSGGAIAGICGGVAVMATLWETGAVHPYLLSACGIIATFVVGYAVGLALPPPGPLPGLTWWDRKEGPHVAPEAIDS